VADASAPTRSVLEVLADGFAGVVPEADAAAVHERWKPGLGPFEEERQLELLFDTFRDNHSQAGRWRRR
jgi:hypothetical protein